MRSFLNFFAGPISFTIFCFTLYGGGTTLAANAVSVMDDGDPGFTLSPATGWSKATGKGYNAEYFMGAGSGKATWSFSVSPGSYRVSITWYNPGSPYNKIYSPAAPVSVISGTVLLKSTTLNQTSTPSDRVDLGVGWQDLGVFAVPSSSLQVSLSEVASLYVMADAVRIERMDGGVITTPTIASTTPMDSPLPGGISVNIYGTQFVTNTRVLFGTKASSKVTLVSSNQLVAVAPPNPPGVFDLKVITPQGLTGALIGKFKYAIGRTLDDGEAGFQATAPAVCAVGAGFQNDYVYPGGTNRAATASWTTPVRKLKTQELAVTWHDAGAPYNTVFANDVSFEVMDGTNILGTVAANLQTKPNDFTDQGCGWLLLGNFAFASGQAKVVLRNNTDKRLMADAIRVEELFPAPVISSLALDAGALAGETSVLLTGSQFLPGATVMFGNVPAESVTFVSGTSLKATASSYLIGTDLVTVTNPDGQKSSALSFTF